MTTPSALRLPSSATFTNLISIGSIFISLDISSKALSTAKHTIGAPGALYAVVLGLFVTTSYAFIRTFLISYGANIAAHAPPIGPPGKAPASKKISAFAPVIMP